MNKFRDMTDSEKLEIINAKLNGLPLEYFSASVGWVIVVDKIGIYFDECYRIPKRPMSIDWSVLKDEYICAARDAQGEPYAYTMQPKTEYAQWIFQSHDTKAVHIRGLKSYDPGTVDWQDSLIWKPGHEPK